MNTPGPWHLIGQTEVRNANGCTVCVTSDYRVPGKEHQAIADAQLIAAAPDLLTALRDCAELLSEGTSLGGTAERYARYAKILDAAHAAINKATKEI